MITMKEKIFGLLFIVLFVIGLVLIEKDHTTQLRQFYICTPTQTNIPELPIMRNYQYLDFKSNYPSFFKEYTCIVKEYTNSQASFLLKKK